VPGTRLLFKSLFPCASLPYRILFPRPPSHSRMVARSKQAPYLAQGEGTCLSNLFVGTSIFIAHHTQASSNPPLPPPPNHPNPQTQPQAPQEVWPSRGSLLYYYPTTRQGTSFFLSQHHEDDTDQLQRAAPPLGRGSRRAGCAGGRSAEGALGRIGGAFPECGLRD
jgi:hypothetical protein